MALGNFKAGIYDLLLLDIKMPKMDGFTLYEKIREIDRNVKVCFLTAFGPEYYHRFKARFPSLDVKCFMQKPVTNKTITNVIKAELNPV